MILLLLIITYNTSNRFIEVGPGSNYDMGVSTLFATTASKETLNGIIVWV